MSINDLVPQIVPRRILPYLEANGLTAIIKDVHDNPVTGQTALQQVKDTVAININQAAADYINDDVLQAYNAYLRTLDTSLVFSDDLPSMVNEDGPNQVVATRNGSDIEVQWIKPPDGYTSEVYVGNRYQHVTDVFPSNPAITTFPSVPAATQEVWVCYRTADGEQTRFGPVASA